MLPDSNINEPASHGFVKFKIAQQPDLEIGTLRFLIPQAFTLILTSRLLPIKRLHTIENEYLYGERGSGKKLLKPK